MGAYNAAIRLAHEVDDQASADLLTNIFKMEEGHSDWAEKQRAQIESRWAWRTIWPTKLRGCAIVCAGQRMGLPVSKRDVARPTGGCTERLKGFPHGDCVEHSDCLQSGVRRFYDLITINGRRI